MIDNNNNNNQLNSSSMLLSEKMNKMYEQINRASIYVRRIRLNARQVGRDLHRYQQSITKIDVF